MEGDCVTEWDGMLHCIMGMQIEIARRISQVLPDQMSIFLTFLWGHRSGDECRGRISCVLAQRVGMRILKR
jgi:hypothetical protein